MKRAAKKAAAKAKKVVERFPKTLAFTTRGTTITFRVKHPNDYYYESRGVPGAVGMKLAMLYLSGGRLRYSEVDRNPWTRRVLVMSAPDGVLALYYGAGDYRPSAVEFVGMCSRYRSFLGYSRAGTRRWYTVEAA